MKKILFPLMLIFVLALSACGNSSAFPQIKEINQHHQTRLHINLKMAL